MRSNLGALRSGLALDLELSRTGRQVLLLIVFLLILVVAPQFLTDQVLTVLTIIGIAIISVHGLNILTGYCGQISIGHVGFMAVGGYTSAILTAKLGVPFIVALPTAGLVAGLAGLIFGLPSLKIRGFYLIMATIAAHFIIIWMIIQFRTVTGGADGMPLPRAAIGSFVFKTKVSYFYLVAVIACLATFFAANIARTRAGRAFVAIRDNDLAAEVMGISLWTYKLQAFFIGCVYAGIAGALLLHFFGFASIDQFPFIDSVWYLGMLIVGGMGSISGAIFGAVALKLLDELVTIVGPVLSAAVAPQAAAALALIARGLVIIVFLVFEPRGLAHGWELIKNYFRLWPFSHEELE